MASDPQAERARLVIEPGSDEPKISGGGHESAAYRPSEDTIDLGRLGDDSDYEFEDEESPAARRRILPLGLAGLALAGFGAIAWYGYQGVTGGIDDEMIPLIQADATPIKSRPLVPGGLEVPYQDKLVLNDLTPDPDKPVVERLLPPPEVPKPPAVREPQTAAADVPKAPAAPAPDPTATAGSAKPQGQENPAPPALNVAPAAGKQAPKATPAPKAAPKAAAVPVPKTPAPATQTAAVPGGYLIQLASLRDRKLASVEWIRLRKSFPKLLGGKTLVLQEADLGSRGVYHRIRAGYFPDRKSAAALCQALKAKNQVCIVAKF